MPGAPNRRRGQKRIARHENRGSVARPNAFTLWRLHAHHDCPPESDPFGGIRHSHPDVSANPELSRRHLPDPGRVDRPWHPGVALAARGDVAYQLEGHRTVARQLTRIVAREFDKALE